MNKIIIQEISEKNTWENFVLNHPDQNFLHSWNWGEFHRQLHHPVIRLGFYHNSQLRGVAQLIFQAAKRGQHLECPGGPLLNWNHSTLVDSFFTAAKNQAKKLDASFVRIRPQLLDTPQNQYLFRRHGCFRSPIHLHAQSTWQLDLAQSLDQILNNMRKTTRYLIRQADKLKITVTTSDKPQNINLLYQLQLQTAQRHHFVPFSSQFLRTQFAVFSHDHQALIFKAYFRQQIVSLALIIFYGQEAVYHYAGSREAARTIPAAYALQWAAIREAKHRGLSRYNFWGIAPSNDPHHRFAGVTLFKTGFGGFRVDYLPAHDLPTKPSYWLTRLFETFRAKFRRL